MNGKAKEQKEKKSGVWSRRGFFPVWAGAVSVYLGFFLLLVLSVQHFRGFCFSPGQDLKQVSQTTMFLARSMKSSSKSIASGSCEKKPASMLCLRSIPISAAPHGGYQRRISSNVRVMAVASTKTELTSKVRPLGLWTGLRLRLEKTGSSRWRKGV